jgi:hypothetical protein
LAGKSDGIHGNEDNAGDCAQSFRAHNLDDNPNVASYVSTGCYSGVPT